MEYEKGLEEREKKRICTFQDFGRTDNLVLCLLKHAAHRGVTGKRCIPEFCPLIRLLNRRMDK